MPTCPTPSRRSKYTPSRVKTPEWDIELTRDSDVTNITDLISRLVESYVLRESDFEARSNRWRRLQSGRRPRNPECR